MLSTLKNFKSAKSRYTSGKKLILSLVAIVTLSLSSFGQAPEGFKYQAVVRDAGNTILNNQAVGMRMTVIQGNLPGAAVYQETFTTTTNAYGLVNLEIGSGTVVSGDFTIIDWSAGPYFMETSVDVTGGTSYSVMGTSQLMSVPYALYAKTSDSVINDAVDDADADPNNEIQDLQLLGNILTITNNGTATSIDLSGYLDNTDTQLDSTAIANMGFVASSGTCGLSIGDWHAGGIIFYLDGTGCSGLVAAPTDLSTGAEWGCYGNTIAGADGTAIGTGYQNTIDIEAGCTTIGTAADLCSNYTDWFLPSKDELNLMYQNIGPGNALGLGNVGGFASKVYWSSSEGAYFSAWIQSFGNGGQNDVYKYYNFYVRAVRAF